MKKKETASDTVKEYIFKLLESQQLVVGSRLPTETQLSNILNISRSSVREALQALKGIGLVESSQGSGYTIISNTKKSFSDSLRAMMAIKNIKLTDISQIREALEVKAAELAIKRGITQDNISYLNECIDNMESISRTDPPQATEHDIAFHRKVAELSGNEFLTSFIMALSEFSNRYILISWDNVDSDERQKLIETHRNIIKHLETGDKTNAIEEITRHYGIADDIIKHHMDAQNNPRQSAEQLLEMLYAEGFTTEQIYAKLSDYLKKE